MKKPWGEMIAMLAAITGEIGIDSVPLAPWAAKSLEILKKDDPEPLEVVVSVPEGESTRGWFYTGAALQKIVGEVNSTGLPGFLGHQKEENVTTEFPNPVTHWVGAKWENGKAYFRGIIDKSAPDLKRWIKANVVRQVSIFGYPKLQTVAGKINVVDYRPLSIDWTPLNRAGMATEIVATGEMDGSHEELREAMRSAAQAMFGNNAWVSRIYDDCAIIEQDDGKGNPKLWKVSYGVVDDAIKLGEKIEVKEVRSYVPVAGEMNNGGAMMNLNEVLAALKEFAGRKEITLERVAGEMGLTKDQAVEALAPDYQKIKEAAENAAKVFAALGISGEMKVEEAVALAGEMKAALASQKKAAHDALVTETLKEKVVGEMAQGLIKEMIHVEEGNTKEQIAGEIDRVMGLETTKAILSKAHLDSPVGHGTQDKTNPYLAEKRVSL